MRTLTQFRRWLPVVLLACSFSPWMWAQDAPVQPAPASSTSSAQDPREIVRRSVEMDHHNYEKAQHYTFKYRDVEREFDRKGAVKSEKAKTYDVTFYYDEPYERLILEDDKPLSDKDQKKEEEKLEKFLKKYRNESESDREKRARKRQEEREKGRAWLKDILNAYDFRLLPDETVNGVETYVIECTPRKDFHPTQPHGDVLGKIKGKLWIEKKDYNWVKAEAAAIDTISFGLFLLRIHPGTLLTFDQLKINDEVWLMRRFYLKGSARIALFKNEAGEEEQIFSDYKKFETTSRMSPAHELPAEEQKPAPAPAVNPPK